MAAKTVEPTRADLVDRYVVESALGWVVAFVGASLERFDGLFEPSNSDDLASSLSSDSFEQLWPEDFGPDDEPPEYLSAHARETIRAARLLYALADSSEDLRAEGDRVLSFAEAGLAKAGVAS
jgi:hypothetical protein